jgi:hypothetical protein
MTFLQELQSLEESTKTKVLVVTSIVLAIIVFYFWLAYFSGIVLGGAQSLTADQDQEQAAASPSLSSLPVASPDQGFWGRVGNGTAIVGRSIGSGFEWIGQAFESPKEYKIK